MRLPTATQLRLDRELLGMRGVRGTSAVGMHMNSEFGTIIPVLVLVVSGPAK